MSDDCLFCRIITGAIPAQVVADTGTALAFQDVAPQAPTHLLVIHKRHTASLADTSDNALLGELFGAVRDVAATLNLRDFRVVVNNGPEAGQSVFHLHAHLLAGRPLQWPPG